MGVRPRGKSGGGDFNRDGKIQENRCARKQRLWGQGQFAAMSCETSPVFSYREGSHCIRLHLCVALLFIAFHAVAASPVLCVPRRAAEFLNFQKAFI